MEIDGRTFLISGGASGLGAACVREFCGAGANVVIADVDHQRGADLADEIGSQACFIATDVTSGKAVRQAIEFAVEKVGGLHGAITCAGILSAARVVGRDGPHDLDLFRRVIEVNLVGTFNVARLAAVEIAKSQADEDGERGAIVMTASVAAWDGQIGQAGYAASKGGVASMTLPMTRELGRHGIRVVSIAPGVFGTPMMQAVGDELRESLESQIPFPNRFGRPEEFASLARHAIENRMLNGTILRLDGGLRMGAK
ncbi:MAG: SDR family NAD(P)-dependent oxidoreductase [Planctomycetota bacterium]|nr:SDR family NAD(P)-dependent oxidoreductase [Planctomycetota bacterium]